MSMENTWTYACVLGRGLPTCTDKGVEHESGAKRAWINERGIADVWNKGGVASARSLRPHVCRR